MGLWNHSVETVDDCFKKTFSTHNLRTYEVIANYVRFEDLCHVLVEKNKLFDEETFSSPRYAWILIQ